MTYSQLRAFHAVAKTRNFSRAADELHISQPAVSLQIRALERDHQLDLFTRNGRRDTRLTSDGEALYELTRAMFSVEAEIAEFLTKSDLLGRGTLNLGADGPHAALNLIADFHRQYPSIRLNMILGNERTTWNAVLSGDVDAAVLANPPRDGRVLRLDLGGQDMMALVPSEYPIAKNKTISLRSLEKLPVIYREQGSNTQRLLEKALARNKVTLHPSLTLGSREAVRQAVLRGLGVGFICSQEVDEDPRAVAIPIRGLTNSSIDKLVCLKGRTKRRVIQALLSLAGS